MKEGGVCAQEPEYLFQFERPDEGAGLLPRAGVNVLIDYMAPRPQPFDRLKTGRSDTCCQRLARRRLTCSSMLTTCQNSVN